MEISSELSRILAEQPQHRLLDSLIDHGDTMSLQGLPTVIQHLHELRDLIRPEQELEALERPKTPEHEPMIFEMDLSPRKKQNGQQEPASTSETEAFASSVTVGDGIELVVHTGTDISEEKQWYLQQIVDKVKQALPQFVDMHDCAAHMLRTNKLGDGVRLRTGAGYVIAIGETMVTDNMNVWRDGADDKVTVRRLPKDHIMRVVGTGIYVASTTPLVLVFARTG